MPIYEELNKFLKREKFDLIFSTHFLTSQAIDYVRKKNKIDVPLINMHTDIFEVFSLWVTKGVDYYITSSNYAKKRLIERGIKKDKLFLFDFPLRKNFLDIRNDEFAIQNTMKIDSEKKTLLICFGAEGLCNLDIYIDKLIEEDLPLNVIIIAGKNDKLKTHLNKKYGSYKDNLNIIINGYVTNMNELIFISDFVFIKPGPTMTFEVMAFKKPIIFAKSDLHEKPTWEFAVSKNVGFFTNNDIDKFSKYVHKLMIDSVYEKVMSHYKNIDIKDGSSDIAKFLVKILDDKL